MKAHVDPDVCVGTGTCVAICPEVFQLNAQGISVVQVDPVPPELEDEVRKAVKNCPVEAISTEP